MAHCFIEKNSKYVDFKIFVPKNKCDFYILYFFQTRFYTKYSDREKKNDILVPLAQQLSIKILFLLFTIFTGYLKLIQGGWLGRF